MSQPDGPPPGPDFSQGVALADIPAGGRLAGHVAGEAALLVRTAGGFRIVGAHCTHYGAPLVEGRVEGEHVHCPWHHACFDLRTGAATCAPAFAPLSVWRTEVAGDTIFAREPAASPPPAGKRAGPRRILIVGGGAAGYAAARRLRELGFDGALTMLSADADLPCDRPNLSKDFLAGNAPAEWIPLQDAQAYRDQDIALHLGCEVASIDPAARIASSPQGEFGYDALLMATGAEPRRLALPGFDSDNVFVLRSLADANAIIDAASRARRVAFIGAGFVGLEAAAALRARGLDVAVVAPESIPMERVLGAELGAHIAGLHRRHGVAMYLGRKPVALHAGRLQLDDGTRVPADLVIVGAGVVPRTRLAGKAGMQVDDGIVVDATLQTSIEGHYAAGDVARYPHAGGLARFEHWVHAERMGQRAAGNMLGEARAFDDVPFFWTHQYDLELRASGHLSGWDDVRIDGDLASGDFMARYFRGGKAIAAVTAARDQALLEFEQALQAP